MPFALHRPAPPIVPLESCTDAERRIVGTCWDLASVQAALADGTLKMVLTKNASADMSYKLRWLNTDALAFFNCLGHHRYENSEWCFPPNHDGRFGPMASDTYRMGFDHVNRKEHQPKEPWVYFKYTVMEAKSRVLVLSAHPENEFN